MNDTTMHNLLPPAQKKELRRLYLSRVAVVGLLALAVALIAGAVSLLPSLVLVAAERGAVLSEYAALEELIATNADKSPKENLALTAELAALLGAEYKQVPPSTGIEQSLRALPEGVALTLLNYNRRDGTLYMEGAAARRDALVAFTRRLEQAGMWRAVELPISDLAPSVDLSWHLTLRAASSTP